MTEKQFDEEFGPELRDLGKRIRATGSSFAAYVDFDGGGARTLEIQPDAPLRIRLVAAAARACGDVGRLQAALLRLDVASDPGGER